MDTGKLARFLTAFISRSMPIDEFELEEIRDKFLEKFAFPEKINQLTLDKYVSGKEDTFCYWLETATIKLGKIALGSAGDFGIFWGDRENSYFKKEGTRNKAITENEALIIFDDIKNKILQLLSYAKDDNLQQIIRISKELPLNHRVVGKILSLYYPEKFVNILSEQHLDYFLKKLDLLTKENKNKDPIEKRRILLDFRNNNAVLKEFSIYRFSSFLYEFYPPSSFREDELISVWIEKTIVSGRKDREEGEFALGKALWSHQRSKNGANIYRNMRLLEKDDLILHLIDDSRIIGISKVSETYDDSFKLFRNIERDDGSGNISGYLVKLSSFIKFENPILREEIFTEKNKQYLEKIYNANKNLFFNKEFKLNRGAYLTYASKSLVELLNGIFKNKNDHDIPYIHDIILKGGKEPPTEELKTSTIKYWQIAPGGKARLWPIMSAEGYIAVGWDELDDISKINSKDDLMIKLKEIYPHFSDDQIKDHAGSLMNFKNLKIGDLIIANRGKNEIVGIGKVIGEYYFDSKKVEYKHCVRVNWFDTQTRKIPTNNKFGTTICPLTKEEYESIIGPLLISKKYILDEWNIIPSELEKNERIDRIFLDNKKDILANICSAINSGKNIIFIGPPGTGKTEIALGLCEEAEEKNYTRGYVMTTATSDWTTFDTIGGYMPREDNRLFFNSGQFLNAIEHDKLLVIDEINRSDIDKAFGQLFTLLSGQDIELQFKDEKNNHIKIMNRDSLESVREENIFWRGRNWRILATMNTLDKASLYQMSYAFMRRFEFIYLGIPNDKYEVLTKIGTNKMNDDIKKTISELWININKSGREIGPAIIKDIIELIEKSKDISIENQMRTLKFGVIGFILPQFEGAEEKEIEILYKSLEEKNLLDDEMKSIFYNMYRFKKK